MTIEINGKTIETVGEGYLVNLEDWNKEVAIQMAGKEGLELTDKHWDVLNYLRDEYINNNQSQPNNRVMLKAMGEKWDTKVDSKTMYDLFPLNPSKQAGRLAGLPESRRKGGY